MEAYIDLTFDKKNVLSYAVLAVISIIMGTFLFFTSISEFEYVVSLFVALDGVLFAVIAIITAGKMDRKIQFTVGDVGLIIDEKVYEYNLVENISIVASINQKKLSILKKELEEIVNEPPLEHLKGCVEITLPEGNIVQFCNIKDIMEINEYIRKKTNNSIHTDIYYRLDTEKLEYTFYGNNENK